LRSAGLYHLHYFGNKLADYIGLLWIGSEKRSEDGYRRINARAYVLSGLAFQVDAEDVEIRGAVSGL
jgi:hypothetical protein